MKFHLNILQKLNLTRTWMNILKTVLPYLYKCLSRGVSNKLKTKHANTHYIILKEKVQVILPIYSHTAYSDKVTKQAYHTLQVRLDCSPWFSSKKLSQRQSKAGQADVTVVSRMRFLVYQFSCQRDEATTVLHHLLDAVHWRNSST